MADLYEEAFGNIGYCVDFFFLMLRDLYTELFDPITLIIIGSGG